MGMRLTRPLRTIRAEHMLFVGRTHTQTATADFAVLLLISSTSAVNTAFPP